MNGQWQTEWAEVADRFGVDMEQVRRDHLISHVLAAISAGVPKPDVVFFGGTALSRTYLTASRLSEDLDLIAVAPRSQVAAGLEAAIRTGLARSHGAVTWRPALTGTMGSQPAVLIVDDQTSVQLQLVDGSGYTWPTEVHDLEQRYADAPPARMTVLTAPGAAAAKLAVWIERRAPRDLYDLWALAERGLITPEAVAVFVTRGPFGQPPSEWIFTTGIDERDWRSALGHQTRLSIRADQARRLGTAPSRCRSLDRWHVGTTDRAATSTSLSTSNPVQRYWISCTWRTTCRPCSGAPLTLSPPGD